MRGLGRSSRRWMASSRSNDSGASWTRANCWCFLSGAMKRRSARSATGKSIAVFSRKDVFLDYRVRVAAVLRDYGMTEREQTLHDSREAHA